MGDPAKESERLISAVSRSRSHDREVTIYVKGFLGRGEKPEYFGPMARRATGGSRPPHGWGPRAHGWCWSRGGSTGWPFPPRRVRQAWRTTCIGGRRTARRVALVGAFSVAAAEQVVRVAARLVGQYVTASARPRTPAPSTWPRRFRQLAQTLRPRPRGGPLPRLRPGAGSVRAASSPGSGRGRSTCAPRHAGSGICGGPAGATRLGAAPISTTPATTWCWRLPSGSWPGASALGSQGPRHPYAGRPPHRRGRALRPPGARRVQEPPARSSRGGRC